jgi:hypothetical protein
MTDGGQTAFEDRAARLRGMHEVRARAELAAADALAPGSDVVVSRGAVMAAVLIVKGLPGPAESAGGGAVSGADGEALCKALEALGYDSASAFFTLSRSVAGLAPDRYASRVRAQIEAADPRTVIALDEVAAGDVCAAMGVDLPPAGTVVRALGRRIVWVEGFEASLVDEQTKRRIWHQLRAAAVEGPVF